MTTLVQRPSNLITVHLVGMARQQVSDVPHRGLVRVFVRFLVRFRGGVQDRGDLPGIFPVLGRLHHELDDTGCLYLCGDADGCFFVEQQRLIVGPLNAWIGRLFNREHRNETIRRLAEAGSEASGVDDSRLRQAKKKLADAETRMRRLQLSIEAGVEPAAVADALNRALEEREAARADLDRVPTTNVLTEKKIAEIVDGLGNVAELLSSADPSELAPLYAALRLEMVYNAAAKIVGVSIRPTGRGSNRVRGGT